MLEIKGDDVIGSNWTTLDRSVQRLEKSFEIGDKISEEPEIARANNVFFVRGETLIWLRIRSPG